MNSFLRIRILLVVALICALAVGCKNSSNGSSGKVNFKIFYVNDDAALSAEEGTISDPFLDIQAALDVCADIKKRCVILVAEGMYTQELIAEGKVSLHGGFNNDFSDRDPQTYTTTIDTTGGWGIKWKSRGKLEVTGFNLINNAVAIYAYTYGGGTVTIANNLIANNDRGFISDANDSSYYFPYEVIAPGKRVITVKDNLMYENQTAFREHTNSPNGTIEDEITLDLDVKYNSIYDSYSVGISFEVYGGGGSHKTNGTIRNNIIADGNSGLILGSTNGDTNLISSNNLIVNNSNLGIYISGRASYGGTNTMNVSSTNDTIAFAGHYIPPSYMYPYGYYDGGPVRAEASLFYGGTTDFEFTIKNDILGYNYGEGVFTGNRVIGTDIFITYSDVEDCNLTPACYNATGNISDLPIFNDPLLDDYTLDPLSPCLGTGENGSNMGAYGRLGKGTIGSRTW